MKRESAVRIYLEEMRIKSWLKNSFVLFALVFSLELFEWSKFIQAVILTLAFCLISSAIYVLNDISDVEKDRSHAVKKNRPIASGQITFPCAWILLLCLMIAGFGLALSINLFAFLLILAYVVINILYSKWLKRKAVIDCFCIAAGFILRVMVGGTIVTNGISDWMFLTVASLSLFMAFGKRRGELYNYGAGGTRDVLGKYEINFLNGIVFMCAGLTTTFYSLWSISQESGLVYTVPIVLFIIIRYLLMVFSGRSEADPSTLILSDKTLLVSCGLCAFIMLALLYGKQIF
ncbi:MAG: UbiA prenyltransferase family protein [Firmicutes bacterium]|nr:UbiA prenyltransferase family protein [Bacillota bacterium]